MGYSSLVRFGLVGLSFVVLPACAASARDLTVVSFGGSLQDAVREAFIKPFASLTGITVTEDTYDGSLSKVSAQTGSGVVTWDVVDVESNELRQGCEEGYFDKIDWSAVDTSKLLPAAYQTSECGVGYMTGAMVLGFDGKKIASGPQTWADFWDVGRFPGKRGMKFGPKWTLELALMADGVPAGEVYQVLAAPAGVDRAFKKLDELKPHIAWWRLGAESVQLLASGEASMVAAYSGRIVSANRSEQRGFQMAWDAGAVYFLDYLTRVKGAANGADAMKFISFAVGKGPQTAFPSFIGYGPVNLDAMDGLPANVAAELPSKELLANAVVTDDQFWLDHGDELTQRFNVWAAQ